MGQHGTRVGDVTMDSGEGWQWGVKTGRGPMRRNEKRRREKQIVGTRLGTRGWVDLACDEQATRALVVALSGTVAGGFRHT